MGSRSVGLTIHSGLGEGVTILLSSGPEYPSVLSESALDFIDSTINPGKLNGTIVTIHGFASLMSRIKKPGEPLFPGWPNGDAGERIAWSIFDEILKYIDYAIFLEGPEPGMHSFPHASIISIDDPPTMSCHPELLKIMGHEIIIEKRGSKGNLPIEAQREFGLPMLITQIDETSPRIEMLSWTVEKVLNFLAYARMIESCPVIPDRTFIASVDGEVRSSMEGEMELSFRLGDFLSEGEKVGTIDIKNSKPMQAIENEKNGYVVRRRNGGHVMVDDLIYSLLEVRYLGSDPGKSLCRTALDNSNMCDVNLKPNNLFHGLKKA